MSETPGPEDEELPSLLEGHPRYLLPDGCKDVNDVLHKPQTQDAHPDFDGDLNDAIPF